MKTTVLVLTTIMNGAPLYRCCRFRDTYAFVSDFNFVRNGNECVPVGPEPIPAGICTGGSDQTYLGSSGWRKIPGNTCTGGKKDEKVQKKCSQGM